MKKLPAFFSVPDNAPLEKAQKRIRLNEGPNKGRQANVVDENTKEFQIVPRTGKKPFKVRDTQGNVKEGVSNSPAAWPKDRKHKVIQGGRVFTSKDLHASIPHSEDQKKLVEGIEMSSVKPHGEGGWTGEWAISGFGKNADGKKIILKGRMPDDTIDSVSYGEQMKKFTTAQREAMYHNTAHFLGLGQYVPTTAVLHDKEPGSDPVVKNHGKSGNHYSVMELIPGATHYNATKNQKEVIQNLHENGELHKLAIMNALLHNTDRHSMNWMMSPKGLHLIDHGLTFDHNNRERSFVYPGYLDAAHDIYDNHYSDNLHKNAKDWLLNIDHKELEKFFDQHKLHEDFKRPIIDSLREVQKKVKANPEIRINNVLDVIDKKIKDHKYNR